MRKLSLAKKFSLLLALFVSITVGVLYLLINSYNEPIQFAQQEARGNAYQRPVEKLLKAVSEHHIQSARGEFSQIKDIQKDVLQAFKEIQSVQEQHGVALQFTADGLSSRKRDSIELVKVVKKWAELSGNMDKMTPEKLSEAHSSLIADIRTTITHLGDTSNLILDPDLDSYYLMDITLVAIPQSQDRIQSAMVEFDPILKAGRAPTMEERTRASVVAAMMKESDLARIDGDMDTTLHEDANFNGKSESLEKVLDPARKTFSSSYSALIAQVEVLASGKNPGQEAFNKAAMDAHQQSYKFWDKAVDDLDTLLNLRIAVHKSQQVRALLLSLVGLCIALVFAAMFLRGLIRKLNSIVNGLNSSSEYVLSASTDSSRSSSTLSSAATEQAAGLQQTMASVEQIAAMVRQNADSAARTQSQVESNQATADGGAKAIDQMMDGIHEIRATNDEIAEQMEAGNREIAEIVKIINAIEAKTNVINDIVSQTKLLSFNASVEAARAGEHGKGFAVVAEEVGNLARMSGTAAKEIGDMLSESVRTVNSIVESTRTRVQSLVSKGRDKIANGESTATRCKDALTEITEKAQLMLVSVTEIANASREQSQGVQEINKAMSQLGQTTQANLSVAQESSTQAASLSSQAKDLAETVHQLKEFIEGEDQAAA